MRARTQESRLSKIESFAGSGGKRFFMLWHGAEQTPAQAIKDVVAAGKCSEGDPMIALAWNSAAPRPASRWTTTSRIPEPESEVIFDAAVSEYEKCAAEEQCPPLRYDMHAPFDPKLSKLSDRELKAQIIEALLP